MLKKTLHKNGVHGGYREPMVVSEQALPKLRLFLPIVKKFQITFGGKLSLISYRYLKLFQHKPKLTFFFNILYHL